MQIARAVSPFGMPAKKLVLLSIVAVRPAAVRQADARRHPAECIAQRHHGAAVQHAAAIAQLFAHDELGLGAFGRAMQDVDAEEFGEGGEIGDGHDRSLVERERAVIARRSPGGSVRGRALADRLRRTG